MNNKGADQTADVQPGPGVIKLFSYSTQLSTKFILLMNVKMPTIGGILTFISMINTTSERLKDFICRFCLIRFFTSQSTIFQLDQDGSSWVEPVLS